MSATSTAPLPAEFVSQTCYYLFKQLHKIRVAFGRCGESEIWSRPNEHTLAPANQLIHLTGNLRQWVLSGIGDAPDTRNRDAEFAARSGGSKAEILAVFEEVVRESIEVIRGVRPAGLLRPVEIQGHVTTVTGALVHVTEHFSYHTGQLIFYVKQLHPEPFDFYADFDLNALGH